MKTKTIYILLTLILITSTELLSEKRTLKIGALLCLSGDCAEWGTNALNGAKLAQKEINEKGGVLGRKIKLLVEDTREANSGTGTISAYRNLMLNKDLNFILGPTWTVGGLSILDIVKKNKSIIITSPTLGVETFNESANHIFNLWPHDSVATEKLALYAIKNNINHIALVGCDDPWVDVQSKTFTKAFKALGGKITIKISGTPTDRNVKAETIKALRTKPDAIMYTDFYRMGTFAKEFRKLGFKGTQLSILMDDTRVNEAQGALENTIFAMYSKANSNFINKYRKTYNSEPGTGADTAYDTIMLYLKAIEKSNSFNVNIVKREIFKVNLSGASGKIVFDAYGGVVKEPLFYKVVKGKFKAI